MILDIENKQTHFTISYFDKDGIVSFAQLPIPEDERFVYDYAEPHEKRGVCADVRSWDDRPVKKIKNGKLSKYRIEELVTKNKDKIPEVFEFNAPRKHFIDIETEITEGFADPDTALNRVLSIGISTDRGKVFVLGLRDMTAMEVDEIKADLNKHFEKMGDTWDFQYIKFDSEYDMMYTFFAKFMKQMYCITGWNVIGYDWKYLINRAVRLKIDPSICSPSGRLIGKNRLPQHKLVVDYMEIVKKWDRVIKIKENFKLDYIGERAIGIAKIKYNGSLKDLYSIDFKKFIYYNAVDCALVHYIDKKLNTMLTFLKLANVTAVEINRAFSPIHIMEALMCREYYKEGKVFVEVFRPEGEQKQFEGALVLDPVVGMHNYVTCYDFASLYPSVMQQFNISPEGYKGKGEIGPGHIKLASGAVFQNESDSTLRKILLDYYGRRKATKRKYLDINKEIDVLKHMLD